MSKNLSDLVSDLDINNYLEYGSMFEDLKYAIEEEEELSDEDLELYQTLKPFFE